MESEEQNTFPFLDLPAELRNLIYRHVCSSHSGKIFVAPKEYERQDNKQPPKIVFDLDNALCKGLLGSCRQVRVEAGGIFWGLNEFACIDTATLCLFLKEIGRPRRLQISSLSVVLGDIRRRRGISLMSVLGLCGPPLCIQPTRAFEYMAAMTNLKDLTFYACQRRENQVGLFESLSPAAKAALFRLRGLEHVRVEASCPCCSYLDDESIDSVELFMDEIECKHEEVQLCAVVTQPRAQAPKPKATKPKATKPKATKPKATKPKATKPKDTKPAKKQKLTS